MDFETIVVGGGAVGCSTAYHLAREGGSVLLLEQFELGHDRGSSHGESRIVRLSYWNTAYIKLAREAFKFWREIESDAGEKLLHITGGIDLAERGHKSFENRVACLKAENVPYEVIDATEIRSRYPQFEISDTTNAIVQGDAGLVSAYQTVRVLADLARKHGAVIKDLTAVTAIDISNDGVEVTTGETVYRAAKLVIAAGPWMKPICERIGLSLPLIVTHEQVAFFRPLEKEKHNFEIGKFPIFIHLSSDPSTGVWVQSRYGFPIFGRDGVKVADEQLPPVETTADTRSFDVDEIRLARLSKYVETTLPGAFGGMVHATTCLYTRTPDDHFILDTLPGHPNVVIASICSGHGFKFVSLMGRVVTDLLEKGSTEYPIDLFRIDRSGEAETNSPTGSKWSL
jgi:sarcosine oxidase